MLYFARLKSDISNKRKTMFIKTSKIPVGPVSMLINISSIVGTHFPLLLSPVHNFRYVLVNKAKNENILPLGRNTLVKELALDPI